MKNERLLKAFGQIDESYIWEARPKTKKTTAFLRRPAAMAASLALFLWVSGTAVLAAAGVLQGYFVDVFDWKGAVVGTSYAQATDEVVLTVTNVAEKITVEMTMAAPDRFPYREIERFGIESYTVADQNGKVILEGTRTEMAPVIDGKASVKIPLAGLSQGTYQLIIRQLVGSKKAEQPLILSGHWECAFTR